MLHFVKLQCLVHEYVVDTELFDKPFLRLARVKFDKQEALKLVGYLEHLLVGYKVTGLLGL